MAYPSAFETLTGTTMPVPVHEAGDYILCVFSQRYGTLATPGGWTLVASSSNINSTICRVYYKKAASSSEVIPNAENSAGQNQIGTTIIIKGVDGATFLDAAAVSETDSGVNYTMPGITPASANSLMLYIDLGGVSARHLVPDHGVVELTRNANSQSFVGVSARYGKGAGVAVPAHNYTTNTDTANKYAHWFCTIAIKDDGIDERMGVPDIDNPPATLLHMLGLVGRSGHLNGTNLSYNPTVEIPTVSNGETGYSDTALYDAVDSGEGLHKGISNASIENASATTDVLIAGSDFASSLNLAGKLIGITHAGKPRKTTLGIGKMFGLSDTTNSRIWQLDGSDMSPNGGDIKLTSIIEVDAATAINDIGTFNSATVTGLIIGGEVSSGSTGQLTFGFLNEIDTMVINQGTITTDMRVAALISASCGLNTIQNQFGQTDTQYYCAQSIRVESESWGGDLAQAVSYPQAYDYPTRKTAIKVSSGTFSWTLKPPTGKTHDVSGWSFSMGDYHNWGVESGAAGAVIASGASVTSATPVLNGSAVAIGGFTISDSKEVAYTTLADCSGGVTFTGCVDAQQITVNSEADFNKLQNCTFKNNTVAIKITGNQTGTWLTDPNLTVSGNTYDIEYTGTTDFSIASASTLTVNNSSTGTLTIVTPTVALTITSNVTALIQYFDTGLHTAIDSTAGTSLVYTYPDTDDIEVVVQAAGYLPYRQTITPSNSTLAVTLVADPIYNASHGLTWTTDFSYNPTTKVLTIVANQEGRDIYSALIDAFIAQAALFNYPFNWQAIGPDRIDFIGGATIDAGDIDFWKGAGMEWYDAADSVNPTHRFCSIKSSTDSPASAACYNQQVDGGTPTAVTLINNRVDHVVQYWSDPNHDGSAADGYDYSDNLLYKVFKDGYCQARNDVLNTFGVSALEPYEYTILLDSVATGLGTGTRGLTISVQDDTALPTDPQSSGDFFDYIITEASDAASAEDIFRQWVFDVANNPTATLYGKTAFNWPDPFVMSGSNFETQEGFVEGQDTTTTTHGFYVEQSADYHPGFTRYHANDSSYWTVPITATGSITGMPTAGGAIRLQIYNETTLTETYNSDPASSGYSVNYTTGTTYSAGDSIRIRFAELNGAASFKVWEATVIATSAGWTAVYDGDADAVYATNAVDGSLVTKFTADFVNDEIDLATALDFTSGEAFAFYCYTLTTSQGIEDFWGGVTALDAGNYRINTDIISIFFDNTTTASKKQTDTARIYRTDGTYPVKEPTTSGFGIDVNWKNPVYVAEVNTGSAVNQSTVQVALTAQGYTAARAPKLDEVTDTQTMNGSPIIGDGTDGNPWRGAGVSP